MNVKENCVKKKEEKGKERKTTQLFFSVFYLKDNSWVGSKSMVLMNTFDLFVVNVSKIINTIVK